MQAGEIREALDAEPFRPFRLRFGSGRSIEVTNPGLVAMKRTGRIAVALHPKDDGWDVIDVMLVESLEFLPPDGGRAGRNGSGKKGTR
jgi:hypothetical protein